ncbi:MAG TPA: hypothetical protein VM911_05245, partial [Pyrinomonadaceae bacterium]|nr:hypothetical protein [Pyrinomonadaceae bacterium]
MLIRPPRALYVYTVAALFLLGGVGNRFLFAQDIQGVDSDDLVGGAGTLSAQPVRQQHRPRRERASANSQPAQAREQASASARAGRETERTQRASSRPVKRKTADRSSRETARARETRATTARETATTTARQPAQPA